MSANSSSSIVRFGTFEVNLQTGELRHKGQKVKLQEQPLQILAALLERPGELVSREELRKKLWPDDTFVDFDHSLNAAIKRLRDALGESADAPVFIETLARRGYRFSVPLAIGDARRARQPHSFLSRTTQEVRRLHVLGSAGVVLAIAALAAALIWYGNHRWRASAGSNVIESLAVLPLENLSRDQTQEYFSDGMTDALITQLSKAGALRVTSRTSTMRFKGTNKSLPEIAKELNVDGVIEGSVMRSDNRVRIAAELILARTDQHLWAESYERDLGDVLKLQSEVAQDIAQQVRIQLTPEQQARLRSAPVVNPEAYEAYLKGRFYGANATGTALKQAQGYYEDAVRKDPTFALAYIGLADNYLDLGAYRWLPPQEAYRQGSEAIHKALQLDKTIGEAYCSLGYLDWQYGWDWQTAEKELRYGVELSPNYMAGHEALVWYLAWSGRGGEALDEVGEIRRLDPAYPFTSLQETSVYYHQRDYKSLVEVGKKSVADYPNGWQSHYFLAVGYEGSGRPKQAVPEYQRAVELSESDTDATAGLAHAYSASGKRIQAENILGEMLERSKTEYVSPYMIGAICAGLGNKDKAFEFLEKSYQEKSPDLAYFLKADLRMDSLRSDPRFQNLMHRMNFPK